MVFGFVILADTEINPIKTTKVQLKIWDRIWEEHQSHLFMADISKNIQPETLALIDVNIIPMSGDILLEHQTLIIKSGKFYKMGSVNEIEVPKDAYIVKNSKDKFILPGLTEGHSHVTLSLSQFLVYLTRGVTTVREMTGYPWMLKAKQRAINNQLLIPNLYVAGHILSNRAWDFYMTQVDTEDDVNTQIRNQAAAGYDFIKIHN